MSCTSVFMRKTRFGKGGGQIDRRRARGVLDLCSQESKARTRRFLWEKSDCCPRPVFFLRGPTRRAVNGQDSWDFSGIHRALDGWMLARAPASPAQGLHYHEPRYFNFHISVRFVALRNLGLLIKSDWSVICSLSC